MVLESLLTYLHWINSIDCYYIKTHQTHLLSFLLVKLFGRLSYCVSAKSAISLMSL